MIVMNEVPNSTNVVLHFFREGETLVTQFDDPCLDNTVFLTENFANQR
jgi:hypothetical protein